MDDWTTAVYVRELPHQAEAAQLTSPHDVSDRAHGWLGSGATSGSGLVRVKTMALGAIPAMSCSATWTPLAAPPTIECAEPDGGVVSSSDRKVVNAFLMLSEDELDLRANRWISADTWELWRAGMSARLARWPFDDAGTQRLARQSR